MNPKTIKIIRWITRIWAVLVAASILFVFIATVVVGGGDSSSQFTNKDLLMMAAFILAWIGLVLGWKWETVGGALTVGGMMAFYILNFAFSGSFPRGAFFIIIVLPGVLFLYLGLIANKQSQ